MSAKEMDNSKVQITTQYWGYRELEAYEFAFVGGGDSSDGEPGGTLGDEAATEGGASPANSDTQVAGWLGEAAKAISTGVLGNLVYDGIKGIYTAPVNQPPAPATPTNPNGTLPSTGNQGAPTHTISDSGYYGDGSYGGYSGDRSDAA